MLSLVDLRNRHFLASVRTILLSLPAGIRPDIEAIAAKAAMSPAPAYYCTYDYALRMLRVLRHGRLRLKRDRRLELWTELNARVNRLMETRRMSLPEALANVLAAGKASQYFISPVTAANLVRRHYDPRACTLDIPA